MHGKEGGVLGERGPVEVGVELEEGQVEGGEAYKLRGGGKGQVEERRQGGRLSGRGQSLMQILYVPKACLAAF